MGSGELFPVSDIDGMVRQHIEHNKTDDNARRADGPNGVIEVAPCSDHGAVSGGEKGNPATPRPPGIWRF